MVRFIKQIIATCAFHHEFPQANPEIGKTISRTPTSLQIYCDRSKYDPVWMVRNKHYQQPLHPCTFAPTHCEEEQLEVIGNGQTKFKPGHIAGINENVTLAPHSAIVQCNDAGFYMLSHDEIWRGSEQVWLNISESI